MKNLGLKAFSLLVAALLAVYVHGSSNTVMRTFVATIELSRLPANKVVVAPQNPTVLVTLRGPGFVMGKVPNSPPVFSIAMPAGVENKYRVNLAPSDLKLPTTMEVVSIDPQIIEFALDDVIEKELPIVVPRIGSLEETIRAESISVEPEKVRAAGPRGELRKVSSLETEALDLRTIHEDSEISLAFRAPPALTKLSHERVMVAVKVVPVSSERRIEGVPLEVRTREGAASAAVTKTKMVNVVVRGSKQALSDLKRNPVAAFVVVPERFTPGAESTVNLALPPGVELVAVEPARVTLERVTTSKQGGKPIQKER